MKREFLKGLELDNEVIDSIMAEYGKGVQGLREQLEELKGQNETLKENSKLTDAEKLELETFRKEKEEMKLKAEDDEFTKRVEVAFGDSQFINELTKKALINEMKSAIKDTANVGKSDKEIFEALTKDQENIFVNPNKPVEIPSMGNVTEENTTQNTPMFW